MIETTIIVCTRNRAVSLVKALDSITCAIMAAPHGTVEVVIVNNGSTDNTATVIAQWKAAAAFPVTALYEERPGLSVARNTAIRASSGKILAFTDDDCTLYPDYLLCLHRRYQPDSHPVMRGGKVELGDPTDQPFSIKLDNEIVHLNHLMHPGGFILGANMTIPREIIHTVGLFDERFGAGALFKASEDTDYIYRVHKAGFTVEYVPDMMVKHFHGRKNKATVNNLNYGYQIGHGALYAKHIRDLTIIRHFYWDFRKCISEIFGHDTVNHSVGLSYRSLMCANVQGILMYALHAVHTFFVTKTMYVNANTKL